MTHRTGGGRTFHVGALARVEGEGALHLSLDGDEVTDLRLAIYEPPRFFEGFLRGRAWTEPPDITARICGICPVAYQMSACAAIEDACGVAVPEHVRLVRRLLYCGEWVESHSVHVFLLHAPDFLGYDSALEMAADHRDLVERGLRIKQAGNRLMEVVGGRSVHPVNVKVGGFYRLPGPADLAALRPRLEQALEDALETVRVVAGFEVPDVEQSHEFVSLRAAEGYPLESGTVLTSSGVAFDVGDFLGHVEEVQVPHSTALHARLDGGVRGPYAVGALARYSLNSDRLSPVAADAARAAGLGATCRNPFRSIVVRAVEIVEALHEALRLIGSLGGLPDGAPAAVDVPPREGVGCGATEAPRGLLFHRYALAGDGTVTDARIIPPTSQNQAGIEDSLRTMVAGWTHLDDEALQHRCEQAIRNHDPCISCATHFLDLTVDRR